MKKDRSKLKALGPFACALYFILQQSESRRVDTIKSGRVIDKFASSPLGWFSGSFILFRGVVMSKPAV